MTITYNEPGVTYNDPLYTYDGARTDERGRYELWSVDRAGARFGTVRAQVEEIEWALNEPDSCRFAFGTLAPGAETVQALSREVQVWRNGRLMWWGVPVRPEANSKRVTVQASGLTWYFDHRYFGKANRTNYLLNGSFENDLANWTTVNTTPTIVGSHVVKGTKAVLLEQTTARQEAYLEQVVRVTGTAVGTVWTLAGHFFIPPETWQGEAFDARGLTISRRNLAGTILESAVYEISGASNRGTAERGEILIATPANVTEDLLIRTYSPATQIYWDALSVTIFESVSSVSSGYPNYDWTSDMGEMIERIATHATDAAYDKSSLNLG